MSSHINSVNSEYPYSTKFRNTRLKYRKWKVKDKTKFLLSSKENDERAQLKIKEALVYDCLENKNIVLSEEEYKFMLIVIREQTLYQQSPITYIFDCSNCNSEFEFSANLLEIMKPEFSKYNTLGVHGNEFLMGEIRNRDFYEEHINSVNKETRDLLDFVLHISSYNGDDTLELKELNEIINNLDVDIFEKIFKDWETMKFKLNSTHKVECTNCNNQELYMFDELPDFFPDSWSNNAQS